MYTVVAMICFSEASQSVMEDDVMINYTLTVDIPLFMDITITLNTVNGTATG